MPILREIIATKLETCKLHDRHFKLIFQSKNDKSLVEHSPLADITNTQKCDPSSSSYQSKINQNLQDTDTDSDFETDLQIKNKCGKLHLIKVIVLLLHKKLTVLWIGQ